MAGALARNLSAPPRPAPALSPPLLGLIGSDHPVARSQLSAADALTIPDAGPASITMIQGRMATGAALVCCALPQGLDRADAAKRIMAILGELVAKLPMPGSLLVSGGATLRALCSLLGTQRLDVIGQCEPGVPVSTLRGGTWDGVPVVSKSGAFGPPDLLARLISQLPLRGSGA